MEMSILINDHPIEKYPHEGKIWVEGRKSSEFKIFVRNNTYQTQKVVVSVDGQNVMTGDATWKRGYVLYSWQSIVIPGWRHDSNTVSNFYFSSLKDSYNQRSGRGSQGNVGVIGCLVFREKIKPPITYNYYPTVDLVSTKYQKSIGEPHQYLAKGNISDRPRGIASGLFNLCQNSVDNQPVAKQSLGTGYGEKSTFRTVDVFEEFEETSWERLEIYYDERKGLINRGIIRQYHQVAPNAFPNFSNDGVPPPVY